MAWSVVGNEIYLREDGASLVDCWNSVPYARPALFDAGVWATTTAMAPYDADAAWLIDIRQVQITTSATLVAPPATLSQGVDTAAWSEAIPPPIFTFDEVVTGTAWVTVPPGGHLGRISVPLSASAVIDVALNGAAPASLTATSPSPEWTSVPRLYDSWAWLIT